MKRLVSSLVVATFAWLALASAVPAKDIKLSPPQKAGSHTWRVAFLPTDLDWVVEQKYFVIDGHRVELPPVSLGYDRAFSTPRWVLRGGQFVGLKYWEFDKQNSRRRVVQLSYPGYRVVSRGAWAAAPGGDTVPDPPQ